MRILYVYSGKARPTAGGLDLVVRQQLQALTEAGHHVTFVSRGRYEHALVRNVSLRVTPAHVFASFRARYYYSAQHRFFSWLGSQFLKRGEYDAVVGWLQQSRSLFRTANKLGIPCFLNCTHSYFRLFDGRDSTPYAWPYTREEYLDEEYERADYLLTPSLHARDTFVRSGFADSKALYVGRGADVQRFVPGEPVTAPFRLVFFGLVSDRKGILQAVDAWREANVEGGEFWIVGHVMEGIKRELQERLPANAFIKGFTNTPEQWLRQCHVQILPTHFEGMAKSLVEGAACGLVSITTPESGFPVVEGETGYYVERDDIGRMADVIRALAADPVRRQEMAEASRLYVQRELTWPMFRRRFVEIVERRVDR